ncbi:hypothetical protein AAG747_01055 [Rapidithrix thailandica]|uniref:Uncharacterized protein n=1 Tax=Rapidithrix thailandica TaxID=413964 RepID=A0AAW9S0L9_9BACT
MQFPDGKTFLDRLRVLYFALISGPFLFFIICYFGFREGSIKASYPGLVPTFQYAVPVVCLVLFILGHWVYRKTLLPFRTEGTLREKLMGLFRASLLKYAALEGASLFTVIIYYLTGHIMFAGMYIVVLVVYSINSPTAPGIVRSLRMKKEDAETFMQNKLIE